MLEAAVEEYLRTEVEGLHARCEKTVDLTRIGAPDREVQWPSIGIDKVELKKPGETPKPHQTRYHEYLAKCGQPVYLLDSKEAVDRYTQARRYGKHAPELWSVNNADLWNFVRCDD